MLLALLIVTYAMAVTGLLLTGSSVYDAAVKGGPGAVVVILIFALLGGEW